MDTLTPTAINLTWLMQQDGLTEAELARRTKTNQPTIHRIITGKIKNPKAPTLRPFAEFFGVTIDQLMGPPLAKINLPGTRSMEPGSPYLITPPTAGLINMVELLAWSEPQELPSEYFSWIAVYNTELAAGHGRLVAHEYRKKSLPFVTSWLRKIGVQPNQAALVYVDGDSMEPRISDGAMVLVDCTKKSIRNGAVYAIRINDEVLIKRLFLEVGGAVVVRSDNPTAGEQTLDKNKLADLDIIGQVVWQGAMVR